MARYTGPVCKLCRREGMKLFLKGTRCMSKKCSMEERKNPPGLPSKRKGKVTEYSFQLREKQKVKRIYGVLEKKFRDYFDKAHHAEGITGELLLQFLERRLDNVVFRLGFATSRSQARTFITHGHVMVNGHRVDIASYQIKIGDKVSFNPKFQSSSMLEMNINQAKSLNRNPNWLSADFEKKTGEILSLPKREHVDLPVKEQVIVELYSK